jgi:hypothetical protein
MSSAVRQWFSEKQMQGFFQWQVSAFFIGGLFSIGIAMWSYHKFAATYGVLPQLELERAFFR